MNNFSEYYTYLKNRSIYGYLYRNFYLYPILNSNLFGNALDVGCGIGDMLAYRKSTIGVDVNPNTVEYCRKRGYDARLMNSNELPFGAGEFDSVLMDNVLEHLADPAPLLHDIHRVLKSKSGVLLIGVPGEKGWRSDSDHKVFYDQESLIDCLASAGFRHIKTFYMPLFKSKILSKYIRQYCIYSKFTKI